MGKASSASVPFPGRDSFLPGSVAPKVIAMLSSFSGAALLGTSFAGVAGTPPEVFDRSVLGMKVLEAVSQIATAPTKAKRVPGAACFIRTLAEFHLPRISLGWAFTRLINSR